MEFYKNARFGKNPHYFSCPLVIFPFLRILEFVLIGVREKIPFPIKTRILDEDFF